MSIPGFFTRGVSYELPHPPINPRLILIAHAAIARGLDLLRSEPPDGFALPSAREDDVTEKLQWILENRLRRSNEVPGFDRLTFGRVWREPKVHNFDGVHPDKMPDLVFDLQRDSLPILGTHDGLFVECKPVDNSHPAGQDYCDSGLVRFVNGDYAWAMQEGMMVAYARHGRSIAAHLSPALRTRHGALAMLSAPTAVPGRQDFRGTELLHASTHARGFSWPAPHGPACTIQIFHSWHKCG